MAAFDVRQHDASWGNGDHALNLIEAVRHRAGGDGQFAGAEADFEFVGHSAVGGTGVVGHRGVDGAFGVHGIPAVFCGFRQRFAQGGIELQLFRGGGKEEGGLGGIQRDGGVPLNDAIAAMSAQIVENHLARGDFQVAAHVGQDEFTIAGTQAAVVKRDIEEIIDVGGFAGNGIVGSGDSRTPRIRIDGKKMAIDIKQAGSPPPLKPAALKFGEGGFQVIVDRKVSCDELEIGAVDEVGCMMGVGFPDDFSIDVERAVALAHLGADDVELPVADFQRPDILLMGYGKAAKVPSKSSKLRSVSVRPFSGAIEWTDDVAEEVAVHFGRIVAATRVEEAHGHRHGRRNAARGPARW